MSDPDMSCQRKRTSDDEERCSDEVGANEPLTTLSSPRRKKVKKNEDDIEILEPSTFEEPGMMDSERQALSDSLFNANPDVDRGNPFAQLLSNSPLSSNDAKSEKTAVGRSLNTGSGDPSNFSYDLGNDIHNLTMDDVFQRIGLSEKVRDLYKKKRNISELYDWQKKFITDSKLLEGGNYVLSLQSGAGKSLVAELLMIREALVKNRSSIYVLPYVAAAQEKIQALSVFKELGIFVEKYVGSGLEIPPVKRSNEQNIYVATIEGATTLVDSLIRENRLKEEIGLFVVDGLHMIGEKRRGAALEKLIFKCFMFGSGQIVGMSTALGTDDETEMCKFMEAKLFSSDFQPGEVTERVMMLGYLFNVNNEGDLVLHRKMKVDDMDSYLNLNVVVSLIKDVIPQKPVLIFCPSKFDCEYVCERAATLLPESYKILNEEREELIDIIKDANGGHIDKPMEVGIRAGIAYHHAGLTDNEKHWIETAFKNDVLCVLCATSTLAAGVNLPVKCVIINQPMIGKNLLEKSKYLQMIGRAGRGRYKDEGESITIVGEEYEEEFRDMLKSPLRSCQSQMLDEFFLMGFIIYLINLMLVVKVEELQTFLSKTLAGIQNNDKCLSLMEKALESLKEHKIVKIEHGVISKFYYG
uniref:Helicase POLQ-like n=1 Tax=Strongyloides papillosus TaxID=174720 RepID=A0A0N5BTB9_STREA